MARRVLVGVASVALSTPTVGVILASAAPAAAAVAVAPAGSVGYDVSHPQCGRALPSAGAFGIVGVNGGLAFAPNKCLAQQYAAMSDHVYATGLYINTGNPGAAGAHRPTEGARSPALCMHNSGGTDIGCAYDYGWMAAADSIATAQAAGVPISGRTWWLDVERENSWSDDPVANAADLQGAVDSLRSHGVDEVGIYSTATSWKEITANYATTTAAAYKLAWQPLFSPKFPLESLPLWVPAGSKSPQTACASSFTGAPVRLAQYIENGLDTDLVCGAVGITSLPPAPKLPGEARKLEAHMAHRKGVKLSWKAPKSDGGAVVRTYRIYRGTSKSHQGSYRTVTCTTSSCSWTDTKAKHHKRYYYRVKAINIVGKGPRTGRVDAKGR
ncbi:MAG TPA: hypothetical protein VGJ14_16445 [Sporichthyaceae bacterium]